MANIKRTVVGFSSKDDNGKFKLETENVASYKSKNDNIGALAILESFVDDEECFVLGGVKWLNGNEAKTMQQSIKAKKWSIGKEIKFFEKDLDS